MRAGRPVASKPRTGATPDRPAQKPSQFSRLPRPSALTMPMPVITVSVRPMEIPPVCGHLAREGRDRVEQPGAVEDVGVAGPRRAEEALRLPCRGEQPLAVLEADGLVAIAVRNE